MQYVESWVVFGSSAAAPQKGRITIQPVQTVEVAALIATSLVSISEMPQ